jgi:hypothetical protein
MHFEALCSIIVAELGMGAMFIGTGSFVWSGQEREKAMKKLFYLLIGAMLAMSLFGCAGAGTEGDSPDPAEAPTEAPDVVDPEPEPEPEPPSIADQIANPVVPAASAEEVFTITGINIVLHNDDKIGFEVGDITWSTIGESLAQAEFWAKDMNGVMPMGEATLTLRAMTTENPEDISGDYNEYQDTTTETYTTSSGTSVTVEIRSTEDFGSVAIWYNPNTGSSWSASFSEFTTDYMTTAAVMKYLVEDIINLN